MPETKSHTHVVNGGGRISCWRRSRGDNANAQQIPGERVRSMYICRTRNEHASTPHDVQNSNIIYTLACRICAPRSRQSQRLIPERTRATRVTVAHVAHEWHATAKDPAIPLCVSAYRLRRAPCVRISPLGACVRACLRLRTTHAAWCVQGACWLFFSPPLSLSIPRLGWARFNGYYDVITHSFRFVVVVVAVEWVVAWHLDGVLECIVLILCTCCF